MRGQDAILLLMAASSLPPENRLLYIIQSIVLKSEPLIFTRVRQIQLMTMASL